MKQIQNILKVIALVFVLAGCASTSNQISNTNLADLYRETGRNINPQIQVYHSTEKRSQLDFRLESKNLLYLKPTDGGDFTARVKITYMLFESFSSTYVIDSSSVIVEDVNNEMLSKEITGKVNLEVRYPNKYVLKVTARDLNKGKEESVFITIDKTSKMGRQNFEVRDANNESLVFRRKFGSSEKLKITYADAGVRRIAIKYFDRSFPLTPPPFAVYSPKRFNFEPDSMYYVDLDEDNAFFLDLNKKGMFHIQTDSASKEGLTLIRYEDNFPDLRNASQMIEPLRFITTNKEYTEIKESEFQRDGVEQYWLTVSASPDRARELIRTYYHRVEDANNFFTTHIEGWKTDRGLIYVVFGPPDVIYKNSQGESWIYGNGKTQPQITYNFSLTFNPFSSNDLRLERNPEYKTYWYKAVDTWRQGRVYKY